MGQMEEYGFPFPGQRLGFQGLRSKVLDKMVRVQENIRKRVRFITNGIISLNLGNRRSRGHNIFYWDRSCINIAQCYFSFFFS